MQEVGIEKEQERGVGVGGKHVDIWLTDFHLWQINNRAVIIGVIY